MNYCSATFYVSDTSNSLGYSKIVRDVESNQPIDKRNLIIWFNNHPDYKDKKLVEPKVTFVITQ